MKRKKIIPDNSKKVFTGIIFDVYQWEQELYDGSKQTFEILSRPDTVVIIPTTKKERLVMLMHEQPTKPIHLTFPGGRADRSDNLENEARRELLEETGLESEKINLWKSFQPEVKIDWMVHFFVAKNCKKTQEPKPDSGEKISLKELSFDKFLEMVYKKEYKFDNLLYEFLRSYYDKEYKRKIKEILFS